jgi:hypothetical protein
VLTRKIFAFAELLLQQWVDALTFIFLRMNTHENVLKQTKMYFISLYSVYYASVRSSFNCLCFGLRGGKLTSMIVL